MLRPGKDKGLASPIPLGLAGLATAVFLMGIALIFQSPAAWAPYLLEALLFGGLIEVLAGMWAFAYGDPLAATTFTFVGAFFSWWGLSHVALLGTHVAAAASVNSMGMVFIVAGVVILLLWIASFYESAAMNLTMLFLWIALGLTGIAMFTSVQVLAILAGIAAIISGLIGAYAAFAAIYNETSLKESVPLGEPDSIRKRSERDEMDRIHRIHPNDHADEQVKASA